ncbi:hypothetical protein FLJC2902T_17100 [Flavobacterium limnosediminis JC2902]|uniref:Uncharacterized protein n=1 Tax=Flavobacterium limnosediminis JC2902 TaxID=1341181 RepID=V6SPJ1_9FLAO|nr:hypothetical protein [Flavobacterium limnosediminis]ESU28359.1 hypothetical protein FLJC2902T_17100 [Flavobacterium limnosediminis JC2902]
MKKSIFIPVITIFTAGMIVINCKSDSADYDTEVDEITREGIQEAAKIAEEDSILEEMRNKKIIEDDKVAWAAYKAETDTKIKAYEKRISNLKSEIKKATKKDDDAYLKNVDRIEKKNAELNTKLNSYLISTESDWEDFKTELDYELEELGKSINNLKNDQNKSDK